MKILIIDDERSIRNSLKEILADEGYDVDVAENGATGCAMVDKEKYSVIFCDIKMPEMDGMEVLDIYEWTTDWSDLFDAGHEWYGACCWSIYDKSMNRYVVMLVSATD